MRMPSSPGQTLRVTPGPTRATWSASSGKRSPSISISPPPREGHVDLLLAVLLVVVHGVVVVVGRHVDDLHAERFDPELGPGPLEGAAEDGLHLVDLLHRVSAHLLSPPDLSRPRLGRIQASCRTLDFQARFACRGRAPDRLAPS